MERKGRMPTSSEINLPPLPPGTHGKPKGNRYKRQFGVIVLVPDEPAQKALFEELKAQGRKCKVVNT
ncbi:hypothetical protein [Leisingera sp. M658]|uniref:hypothetical protein n=1 Tax=Leisingera sp. M658 TaxID=2867015 RepID=UPI00220118F7|nr:hypothetical protein K3724_10590 [Leisingera sp. M658]